MIIRALLAVVMCVGPSAYGESDSEAGTARADSTIIEEVIVSARKREERLQDLPGSAAALTSDYIEDIGGLVHLRDVTDQIVLTAARFWARCATPAGRTDHERGVDHSRRPHRPRAPRAAGGPRPTDA